jgi:hypothetical protein
MIIISTIFLYKSHMGTHLTHHQADTSDSDNCTSVGFNLLQYYKKSHISMMAHVFQKPHTVFVGIFLITTLQTDMLASTFSITVNVINPLVPEFSFKF